MSELRQKMLTDLRIRNYAERTQAIYIRRVAEMAQHFGRSPDTLGREEIRGYLRYLKEERPDVLVEAHNKLPFLSPLYTTTPRLVIVHHLFGTTAFQQVPLPMAVTVVAGWKKSEPGWGTVSVAA